MICWIPPEKADEQKETVRVATAIEIHMTHFFEFGHVMGFRGSFSIHSTTYGSSVVPDPS
jgi:hypothetical protein